MNREQSNKFNIRMISTTDDDYPLIMRGLPNKEKYQLLCINDAVFVPLYQVIDEITKADIIKRNGVECCPTCMKPITPQQKVGKWMPHMVNDKDESIDHDVCSECHTCFYGERTGDWKYCPYCGAKMLEPQESEG